MMVIQEVRSFTWDLCASYKSSYLDFEELMSTHVELLLWAKAMLFMYASRQIQMTCFRFASSNSSSFTCSFWWFPLWMVKVDFWRRFVQIWLIQRGCCYKLCILFLVPGVLSNSLVKRAWFPVQCAYLPLQGPPKVKLSAMALCYFKKSAYPCNSRIPSGFNQSEIIGNKDAAGNQDNCKVFPRLDAKEIGWSQI